MKNFYQLQREQQKKSLLLFLPLVGFYFFAVGLLLFLTAGFTGLLLGQRFPPAGKTLTSLLVADALLALLIAAVHYVDARKNGAAAIRRRLQARPPDPSDLYHKRFSNTLDEMRIAAGLPRVLPFILPTFAVNSMALIERDGTPSVLVTEGLLADFTREEQQAVIAHELAHLTRGDTIYITLVCSLVNFFERIREAFEPERHPPPGQVPAQARTRGASPLYALLTLSTLTMHLLSTLVSRQREFLADAVAVEISRDPAALARAVYKAHQKNSFVGDFNIAYSPLLIVPPRSTAITDGFFSRLFNSHPPLMRRLRLLADMVPTTPAGIVREVWRIHKEREKARLVLHGREESLAGNRGEAAFPIRAAEEGRVWALRASGRHWEGPFSLGELLEREGFSAASWVRNIQEGVEAPAGEFPQVRQSLAGDREKRASRSFPLRRCPRCRVPLRENVYEGVTIDDCPDCGGKLVDAGTMDRIITRREVAFSEGLKKRAREFEETFLRNPVLRKKVRAGRRSNFPCPRCGGRMFPRPYNYQYVIPVDKCFACHRIWFDAEELEILQVLIEL